MFLVVKPGFFIGPKSPKNQGHGTGSRSCVPVKKYPTNMETFFWPRRMTKKILYQKSFKNHPKRLCLRVGLGVFSGWEGIVVLPSLRAVTLASKGPVWKLRCHKLFGFGVQVVC